MERSRRGGRGKKKEEEPVELSALEQIRPIEEAEDEPAPADEEGEALDIFEKLPEPVVAEKVRLARKQQATIEKQNKWTWGLRGRLRAFSRPKRSLEQYVTPLEDALSIGFILESALEGKTVADLGAGTGMLGIVCLLAGASKVSFYEIDAEAFRDLKCNLRAALDEDLPEEEAGLALPGPADDAAFERPQSFEPRVDTKAYAAVHCDVLDPKAPLEPADVVIMNPPFGTSKDENIDLEFLAAADRLARESVFFIQKLARTKTLEKKAAELGRRQRILWQFYLEVPAMHFDKKDMKDFLKSDQKRVEIGHKHKFSHKRDLEYVQCCLVEWRRAAVGVDELLTEV